MAHIICPECGKETSGSLRHCLHCDREIDGGKGGPGEGDRARAKLRRRSGAEWAVAGAVVAGLLVLTALYGEGLLMVVAPAAAVFFNMVREIIGIITSL